MGYWILLTNLLSCLIMCLVIRFAYLLTKSTPQPTIVQDNTDAYKKLSLNMYVTLSHALLISMYTAVSFVSFNFIVNPQTQFKLYTAFTIAGGILEIFIACMVWFIIDENEAPSIIRDEYRKVSYHVLDIVKRDESGEALTEVI